MAFVRLVSVTMPKLLQILGLLFTFLAAVLLSLDNFGETRVMNCIHAVNQFIMRNRVVTFLIISVCVFLGLYYANETGIVLSLFQIISNLHVITVPLMVILGLVFVFLVSEGWSNFCNLLLRMRDILVSSYRGIVSLITTRRLISWLARLRCARLQIPTRIRTFSHIKFIECLLYALIVGPTLYGLFSEKVQLVIISLAINLTLVLSFALVFLARIITLCILRMLQFFASQPPRSIFTLSMIGYGCLTIGFLLQFIYTVFS